MGKVEKEIQDIENGIITIDDIENPCSDEYAGELCKYCNCIPCSEVNNEA